MEAGSREAGSGTVRLRGTRVTVSEYSEQDCLGLGSFHVIGVNFGEFDGTWCFDSLVNLVTRVPESVFLKYVIVVRKYYADSIEVSNFNALLLSSMV